MLIDMQPTQSRLYKLITRLRDYTILIVLIAAGFLIIFGFINVTQNRAQQKSLNKQAAITNDLIAQIKALSEDNKKLSQTAANYAYCNSVILATYTQTSNPINIDDLDKCRFTSYPDSGSTQSHVSSDTLQKQLNTSEQTNNTSQIGAVISSINRQNEVSSLNPPSNNMSQPPINKPVPAPQPQPTPSPIITTTPTSLLPGLDVYSPCIDILKLLFIGCH